MNKDLPLFQRPPPPTHLGRYDVRAKIADGGMATVYVGLASADGAPTPAHHKGAAVALKVIRDEYARNRDFVNMFIDEAKIVSRLKHKNIVELYELAVDGPRIFLVMELLFGQSLWQVWEACRDRGVRLRYDMIAWIGARVAEGLDYAHEMRDDSGQPLDIVHRDVNATNIFVTYDGQIKIIDFGLAKAANRASKTAAGVIKGKVAYMSPEQTVGGNIDRRTDVFALGTTLWELSCDRRLFKHTSEIETLKRVHAAVVPDPTTLAEGYPPALAHSLMRALAREPERRHAAARDLARELDACAVAEGRTLAPADVAGVMQELFPEERKRQAAWLADASSGDRPAPPTTLMPPSGFYAANVGLDQTLPAPSPSPFWQEAARTTFAPAPRPPSGPLPDSPPSAPAPSSAAPSRPGVVPPARNWLVIIAVGVAIVLGIVVLLALKGS